VALKTKILDDIKASMKNGDKVRLSVVRMVQSTLKNKEIDDRVKPVDPNDKRSQEQKDDESVLAVLKTLVKQRKDSIEQFTAGGRQDLVDQETAELKILEEYLPQQLGRPEVEAIVTAAIQESGATTAKEMGAVMKIIMAKTQGRADGKLISELVKAKLQ
jgi:uncharacterized protein YqeY